MDEEDTNLTRYYIAQAGSGFTDTFNGPIYQKGRIEYSSHVVMVK